MKLGIIVFFTSLLLGQLGAMSVSPGVVVYLHDVVLVVLVGAGLWKIVKSKTFITPKLSTQIVVFSIAAIASLLFAFVSFTPWQVGLGSLYVLRWIGFALLYVILVQEQNLGLFLRHGLYITGSAFSLLGLVQFVLYPNLRNLSYLGWDPHYYRLFSTFLDPNFAGLFIVLTILLGLTMRKATGWLWISLGVNAAALYLTYSRGSYLALIAGVLVWIIGEKRWKVFWLAALGIALVILIPRPGGDTLRLTREDSTISRIENWQESLQLAQKNPILGYGFNTLRFAARTGMSTKPGDSVSRAGAGVDNSFLFLLVTTGIAGLAAYVWLLWAGGKISGHRGLIMLAAILVHAQFINSLFYPWVMLWLWVYFASNESSGGR